MPNSDTTLAIHRFDGSDIQTLLVDGEPWFAAPGVARQLGYAQAKDLTRLLDDDEKGRRQMPTPSGEQEITIISEADLYQAIMQRQTGRMTDDRTKEHVKRFQRWVTHEVLPSIRRTGSYTAPAAAPALPQDYASALRALAAEVESREAYEERVRELEPKAEYVDRFVSNDDLVTVRSAASQLGMAETALRDWLIEHHWVYKVFIGRRWSEKQQAMVEEWEYRARSEHGDAFRLRGQHNAPRHHNNQLRQTLYLTPEGLLQLAKRVGVKAVQA